MKVLVLEGSTTSAKAMIYDSKEGILCYDTVAYPDSVNDVATHDADGVYAALLAVGKTLCEGHKVDMISLGGTWHSLLICDRSMQPVTRTHTWAYTGASDVTAQIKTQEDLVRAFYERTGCMVHALYPAFKAMHFQKQGMDLGDKLLVDEGSYILYRLTGAFKISPSLASGSGFLNTHTLTWDEESLKMVGISQSQLPRLVDSKDISNLSAKAARALGVPSGIPVVSCHPDGALNQVGAGAIKPGEMTLSVGTSGALRMAFDQPVLQYGSGAWCYRAPTKWLSGAAVSGACNCADWFAKKQCQGKYKLKELDALVYEDKGEPPVFLPFLYGERCPGWLDDRTGSFVGMTGEHTLGQMYTAVLEGVIFNLYQCYQNLIRISREPHVIKMSGGILNSKVWTQMAADIWQKDLTCSKMEQASMLGAAALGLYAAGELSDLEEFDPKDEYTVVSPNRSMAPIYSTRFEKYLRFYHKV